VVGSGVVGLIVMRLQYPIDGASNDVAPRVVTIVASSMRRLTVPANIDPESYDTR